MKKSVACCYLTHEHPDVMDEVLGHICKSYGERDIDIYVYDSSPSGDTEAVVSRYIAEGQCRLYYVPVKFIKGETGGQDEKYLYILKGNGLRRHYDYIWPTKDRCWFEGETLDNIRDAIDEGYDIVFAVDEWDRYEIIRKPIKGVYIDPADFFGDYGALTTNWECLIRRTDTMLDPIDWDKYSTRYNVCKTNNFNQTLSTFVRLSEMDNCRIRVIVSGLSEKKYSDRTKSSWMSSLMEIWIDKWIPMIYSLPETYDRYKMNVIKTQLGHVKLFGSNDSIVYMRDKGMFSPNRIKMLSSMWGLISRIPYDNVRRILAYDEQAMCEELYSEYLESFKSEDYERGYYLFIQNQWLQDIFHEEKYMILTLLYYTYMMDLRQGKSPLLFDGVHSLDELFANFEKYS